ncbi:MAG: hypothetical protein DMG13_12275 [Acidobacteria bacterium]|nr:MAG: hypothetical protein DMG13_12275 [Acidobacteriota bacterium]
MTAADVALTDRRQSAKRKRDSAQPQKIDRRYSTFVSRTEFSLRRPYQAKPNALRNPSWRYRTPF